MPSATRDAVNLGHDRVEHRVGTRRLAVAAGAQDEFRRLAGLGEAYLRGLVAADGADDPAVERRADHRALVGARWSRSL